MKIGSLMDAVIDRRADGFEVHDGEGEALQSRQRQQTDAHVSAGRGPSFLIEARFRIALTARIIYLLVLGGGAGVFPSREPQDVYVPQSIALKQLFNLTKLSKQDQFFKIKKPKSLWWIAITIYLKSKLLFYCLTAADE